MDQHIAPDIETLQRIVDRAIDALDAPFRAPARAVMVRIEDFAPDALLAEMQIDDPFELTGLYEGIPLTEKSRDDLPGPPDTIWLFRRPILEEWIDRGDIALADLVTHVYVHELAHHFGWTDAQIARIDRWWE